MDNKPILVTGIHRSGSTFVGKILTLNKEVAYIQEPFNRYYGLDIFDVRFKYLKLKDIDEQLLQALDDLISLKKASYNITSLTEKEKVIVNRNELIREMIEELSPSNLYKYVGKLLFRTEGQLRFDIAKYNPFIKRILLKDPEACLASQYLHKEYSTDVIILVRHPLSFAGSLKRLGWRFDFNNFLNQEQLMNDYLEEYRGEMNSLIKNSTVVEEAGLLWNCIYKVLADFLDKNSSFIVVKHEEIAQNPIESFEFLYSRLGLDFNPKVKQIITEHTSKKNPIHAKNNIAHQLKRNSAKLPDKWKNILTKNEINYITEKTEKIASIFYEN